MGEQLPKSEMKMDLELELEHLTGDEATLVRSYFYPQCLRCDFDGERVIGDVMIKGERFRYEMGVAGGVDPEKVIDSVFEDICYFCEEKAEDAYERAIEQASYELTHPPDDFPCDVPFREF